jgi:hypothetical protein
MYSLSSNFHVIKIIKENMTESINLPLVWVLWDQLRLEDLAAELLNLLSYEF